MLGFDERSQEIHPHSVAFGRHGEVVLLLLVCERLVGLFLLAACEKFLLGVIREIGAGLVGPSVVPADRRRRNLVAAKLLSSGLLGIIDSGETFT